MKPTLAILETVSVTALTWIAYKALKLVEPGGFNCSPGLAMIVAAMTLMAWHRVDFATYGLNFDKWRDALTLGVALSVFLLAATTVLVSLLPIGATTPTTRPVALTVVVCAILVVLTVAFLYAALRVKWDRQMGRVPLVGVLAVTVVLLISAPAFAIYRGAPLWQATGLAASLVFFTGFGEELFFRGYVQSRFNDVFGQRWRLLGASIGPGLFISSLLFGAIHVFNPTKPFSGQWGLSLTWGVEAFLGGLLYGYMRELTGSIWAATTVHGLIGVQQGMWQAFLSRS